MRKFSLPLSACFFFAAGTSTKDGISLIGDPKGLNLLASFKGVEWRGLVGTGEFWLGLCDFVLLAV